MAEQVKIPEYLGKCEVLKVHDDGDLTIKCREKKYVVTTEGETFKEVKCKQNNPVNRAELIAKLEKGEHQVCSFDINTVTVRPAHERTKHMVVVDRGRPGTKEYYFTDDPTVAVDNFIRLCHLG